MDMTRTQIDNPSIKIPLDFIYCDHDFNARKFGSEEDVYDDVDSLAKQIKSDGQLSPVLVRPIPSEEMEEGQLETYEMVFGFLRVAAMRVLERDTIMAQIWDGDELDRVFVNLAENVSRRNLKPWEKAQRYAELKSDYGLTGARIASRLGENKGHVNNLIRIIECGHPRIVELWKDGHAKAGTDVLARYIIKAERSHEDQWEAWLKHCGLEEEQEGDGVVGEEEKASPVNVKAKRPSVKHIENGLSAISASEEGEEWNAGAKAALRWVLGKTKTLPRVYDPRKKVKKEEE
jgi:ParB/RepB/Spo0J family partition protein